MAADIDIRKPATVSEYRDALDTIAAAWHEAFAAIVTEDALAEMARQADRDDIEDQFHHSRSTDAGSVLLALIDDGVVATGSVVWGTRLTKAFAGPRDAELRTLYVRPDHWGEGIGSLLLDALDAEPPERAERLVLETFRDNRRGRQFYEARGFSLVGESDFSIAGDSYPTVLYARDR